MRYQWGGLAKKGLRIMMLFRRIIISETRTGRYREILISLIWVIAIQFLIDLQKGTARCRYLVKPLRWSLAEMLSALMKFVKVIARFPETRNIFKVCYPKFLKQNSNPRAKFSPSFKFIEPEVEQRSLSIYDSFSEGVKR